MEIKIKHNGNFRFKSTPENTDHDVVMDAKSSVGGLGEAPTPKQMVLHGLAGCTGMDVVAILKKKKVDYDSFEIEVQAGETSTHPMVFKKIKLIYRFRAAPETRPDIERAIELSTTTFCGVSAMLEKTAEIETELIME